MAATLEPETESKHHNRHQHQKIIGRFNSENLPKEDPWQNWHKPGNAGGTEIAAVAHQ